MPRDAKNGFERGFLRDLSLTGWQFLESIESIWRIEPVSKIIFRGPAQAFMEATQNPLLSGLRGLSVSGVFDEIGALQALTESPHVVGLQDLSLHLTPARAYPPETLAALRAWPLPNLRRWYSSYLLYAQPQFTEPLQEALLQSSLLANVEDCTLLRMIGRRVAAAFALAPHDQLQFLRVTGDADEAWLATLLRSARLKNLRQLSLTSGQIHEPILAEFFHSELLGQLTQLSLHIAHWSPNSLINLLRSPKVQQLETLHLSGSVPWTPEVTEAIMTRHGLTNLRYFGLQTHVDSSTEKERLRSVLPADCVVG